LLEQRCRWLERVGTGGEVRDQPARDRGGEQSLTALDNVDRLEEALSVGVLEQEAGGAGAQGAEDVLVEVEGRQHEHARRRLDPGGGQPCCDLDPVHAGHADVPSGRRRVFVNTAASVLSSLIPVPGGIGAAEATLSAGLIAVGVDESTAFAIAVTQRLSTFYLPPIWGYFSLRWLSNKGYV
jgi:Lysylphosphatidylglycerol synthase TM region